MFHHSNYLEDQYGKGYEIAKEVEFLCPVVLTELLEVRHAFSNIKTFIRWR